MKVLNSFGIVLAALVVLGAVAAAQQPQPMDVKLIEPTSLPRGQTTAITVIASGLPDIQSAFIMPPVRVKVVEIKRLPLRADGTGEAQVQIAVDADANPGERTLYVSSPGWEFELTKIRIQDHNIRIADLKPGLPDSDGIKEHPASNRLFHFTLFDEKNDVFLPNSTVIGKIKTAVKCGDKLMDVDNDGFASYGVSGATESATSGTAQQETPTQAVRRDSDAGGPGMPPPPQIPKTLPKDTATALKDASTGGTTVTFELPQWAGKGACEVRVSVMDKAGNESNVLRVAAGLK